MRIAVALLLAALTLGLSGCPGGPTYVVQQYAGPVRPNETISILRVNGKEELRLHFLDDEEMTARLADDARLHIELLPGRHTLSVRDVAPGQRVSFEAQPNKVYRVTLEGRQPHVHEVDRDSDALGPDVTAP